MPMNVKTVLKDKIFPFFVKYYGFFFIPLFVFAVFLVAQASFGIYPFGSAVMSSYDMLAQENPFIEHYFSVLKGESGLFHTFYIGGGMDMFGSLAYCTISPFTFLFLLGGEGYSFHMVSFVLPLKVACAGISAFCLLRKYFRSIPDYLSVTLAILYAYGGYLYVANTYIVWLDISIYIPVVICGFIRLMQKDDLKLFSISLACMIYACFSIACFSFFLLFPTLVAYVIFCVDKNERKRKLTRLCFGFVLAVAMALPLMFPALYAYTKAGRNTGIFSEIFRIYSQSQINDGKLVEHVYEKFTYILCNSTFIFLGGYYFVCSKKGDKFALFSVVAFLILVLPCIVDESMLLLNMGSYMSYALRFGFLLDGFGLIVAAKGLSLMCEKSAEKNAEEKSEAVTDDDKENEKKTRKPALRPTIGIVIVCVLVCSCLFFTFRFFNFVYDGDYKTSKLVSAFMKWTSMSEGNMPFSSFFPSFAHSEGGLEVTGILFFAVTLVFLLTLVCVKYLNVKFRDIVSILCVLSLSQAVFFNFSLVKGDRQGGSMENYSAYKEVVDGVNNLYGENYYRYKNYDYFISSDSPLVVHSYGHSLFSSMADAKNITVQTKFGYAGNGKNSTKTHSGSAFTDAVLGYKYIVYNVYDGDESDANGKSYYKNAGVYGFEKPCAEVVKNEGDGGYRAASVLLPEGDFEGLIPHKDVTLRIEKTADGYDCLINGKSVYAAKANSGVRMIKVVGHKITAELSSLKINDADRFADISSDKWKMSGSVYKVTGDSSAYVTFTVSNFENAEAVVKYGKSSGNSNAFVALRIYLENGEEITLQLNTPKFVVYENKNVLPMCAVVDGKTIDAGLTDNLGSSERRRLCEVATYDFLTGKNSGKTSISRNDITALKNYLEPRKVEYKLAKNEIILPKITATAGQSLYLNYVDLEGYEVKVNGKKTKFVENDLDFMIIPLEEGENTVTIKYKSPYYKFIALGFIVGGLIVALYVLLKKKAGFALEKAEYVIPYMAYALAAVLLLFFIVFPIFVFLYKFLFKYLKMIFKSAS